MSVSLDRPWLSFDLGAEMQVLSWALNRPGFVTARRILWREVRNADLPPELDVRDWFKEGLTERGESESVAFLTSRNTEKHHLARARVDGVEAQVLATVGLSNGERVGRRRAQSHLEIGTINVAVKLSQGLSRTGLIEALSIAVEARTAAVIDTDIAVETGIATGTGTDCIAVAAPRGDTDYTGLHTAIGEAVGRAVYDAVREGAIAWKAEQA